MGEEEDKEQLNQQEIRMDLSSLPSRNNSSNSINTNNNNTNKKRQQSKKQRIFFRSLTVPPSKLPDTNADDSDEDAILSSITLDSSNEEQIYSPHFLPAIQLIAHVI